METMFQNIANFFAPDDPQNRNGRHGHSQNQTHRQKPTKAPPASHRILSSLPMVTITADDIQEAANKDCLVCLDEHKLGTQACKLPCGHLFHRQCVTEWLEKHCTCPVCRYELETDDNDYEEQRKKRMKSRKARMRKDEISAKSISQLRELSNILGVNISGCIDKREIVDRLVLSGHIEIIEGLPPVEVEEAEFYAKTVHDLRHMMLQFGISEHGAIEKSELRARLLESGRIIIIPDPSSMKVRGGGRGGDVTNVYNVDTDSTQSGGSYHAGSNGSYGSSTHSGHNGIQSPYSPHLSNYSNHSRDKDNHNSNNNSSSSAATAVPDGYQNGSSSGTHENQNTSASSSSSHDSDHTYFMYNNHNNQGSENNHNNSSSSSSSYGGTASYNNGATTGNKEEKPAVSSFSSSSSASASQYMDVVDTSAYDPRDPRENFKYSIFLSTGDHSDTKGETHHQTENKVKQDDDHDVEDVHYLNSHTTADSKTAPAGFCSSDVKASGQQHSLSRGIRGGGK